MVGVVRLVVRWWWCSNSNLIVSGASSSGLAAFVTRELDIGNEIVSRRDNLASLTYLT